MKATVEPQEGNKVKLAVVIDAAEFDKAVDAAFRKIAHEVRVPGFRPGKAPRRVLEQRIGKDAARQQAMQDSLPEFYVQALTDTNTDAISSPELNITGGADTGDVTFDAVVEVRPKVRVPGYEGLQVTIPSPAVPAAEIDAQIDRMRNGFAAVNEVARPAATGDAVKIDVRGAIGGEQVPGLTATDYVYDLGSGAVVPELDAAIAGMSAGDVKDFTAAVPGSDEGEQIEFHVEVKAVSEKVLPEADDAWAAQASEFSTIAALRADVEKRMGMVRRVQSYMALREATLKELVTLVDADDVPEVLVNTEIQRRIDDLAQRLAQQQASIPQYLEATGQSEEALISELRVQSIDAIKADLALRAVADGEGIDVSDDDVDDEIARLSERVKLKPAHVRKNLVRNHSMSALVADIRKTKALRRLMEQVSLVDEEGVAIERSALDLSAEEQAEADARIDDDEHDHDHDHDHEGHDHDHDGHDHD